MYLMQQIGTLYMYGISMEMPETIQHVPYPVPLSTSMLNSLIEWDHSGDWPIETEPLLNVHARIHVDINATDDREVRAGSKLNSSGCRGFG